MNVKSIYGRENQFANNKFMPVIHKTWGSAWVVIAIFGNIIYPSHNFPVIQL